MMKKQKRFYDTENYTILVKYVLFGRAGIATSFGLNGPRIE
jgi:hypothetical protein